MLKVAVTRKDEILHLTCRNNFNVKICYGMYGGGEGEGKGGQISHVTIQSVKFISIGLKIC